MNLKLIGIGVIFLMHQRSDFTFLPKESLQAGTVLKINVYILMPQNKTILNYRKVGAVLTAEDMKVIQATAAENLLFLKTEVNAFYEMGAVVFEIGIAEGDLSSPVMKANALSVLNSISGGGEQDLAQVLQGVTAMVQSLLSQFKKTPSITAYDEALKKAALQSTDPSVAHHLQVSSLGMLMAIAAGNFSMDELSDIATAGLIHDLGLKDITNTIADSHIIGKNEFSNQEKIIYMRHIDLTLERIKKERIPITPGISRIIELHHENWDGSGFKSYLGNKIYRPARVLRIADEMVSYITGQKMNFGFQIALALVNRNAGFFDPQIMQALLAGENSANAHSVA